MALALVAGGLLLAWGFLHVFVVALGEGATGVRLQAGVPAGEALGQGLYLRVPHFFDVARFSGAIHISSISLPLAPGACTGQSARALRVHWRIVDARGFYPLTAANPERTPSQLGEQAVARALCEIAVSARGTSLDGETVKEWMNRKALASVGIQVLALEDTLHP